MLYISYAVSFSAESYLVLLSVGFTYSKNLTSRPNDFAVPLPSTSETKDPTFTTYPTTTFKCPTTTCKCPTTTCKCSTPTPCPTQEPCPLCTRWSWTASRPCPSLMPCPITTPCPSPTPCPSLTTNPSTSVFPTIQAADCSKCKTSTTCTPTTKCPECPRINEENVILSSEDKVPSPGSFIGAALGGAVLGSSFTVIAFFCFRRRSKTLSNCKKHHKVGATSIPNDKENIRLESNDSAQINSNSGYIEIYDEMRKSARILPIRRQEQSKEDVYNHLHESNQEDRGDYYDHAGPAPSLSVMEDGYGVLSTVSGSKTPNYNTLDGRACIEIGMSMTAENANKSDYFILESKKE